ncbi:MAG: protein phosphatase 2C domain-containing protein [bacterium]|nr:protein phosphatase 2C domain-containing protein [bacterium]
MRLLKCPRCNTFNAMEAEKCVICGFELNSKFCPKCGTKVELTAEVCPNCGFNLVRLFFTPFPLKEIVDKKYKILSKERFGRILQEVNPNLTKLLVESPIQRFYASSGNLVDIIEVEPKEYVPVIEKPQEIKEIRQIWDENGDKGKIDFLRKLIQLVITHNLFYPDKIEEVIFDERSRPIFPVSAERKKGFISSDEFICKIISELKGAKDSLWEKKKSEIIKEKCDLVLLKKWFKELEQKFRAPKIRYAGISDKGPARANNEDAILLFHTNWESHIKETSETYQRYLFVLSDGLGGHEKGEIAAELIIEGIKKEFIKNLIPKKQIQLEDVIDSLQVVNNRVYSLNLDKDSQTDKMGGTVSGVIVDNGRFIVFNVGDSPIFIFSDNIITEISTRDVSNTKAKAITQAIGVKDSESIKIHIDELNTPESKFKILICSDGLTDVIEPEEIKKVIDEKEDLEEVCAKLIREAYKRKTTDNVSIILIEAERETVIGKTQ